MGTIHIGEQIKQLREQYKIPRKTLIRGLCSEQMLFNIENGFSVPDKLLVDILIQRLGKSPDKLEMILSYEMYKAERMRDLYEDLLEKGRSKKADYLLEKYMKHFKKSDRVQQMFYFRSKAYAAYRLNKQLDDAECYIKEALNITLPEWERFKFDEYRISTVELENLLFYGRILWESKNLDKKCDAKKLFEVCKTYIDINFTDKEEHAKIYGKCVWLLARVYMEERAFDKAKGLCERAFMQMRVYGILYFMLPLLEIMQEYEYELGRQREGDRYAAYYKAIKNLYNQYGRKGEFEDSIFRNCFQKAYHLDYEIIRLERIMRGYTQEDFIEGIYDAPESLSRIESRKVVPSEKNLEKMMQKLNLNNGRYQTFLITDSFEILELNQRFNILLNRRMLLEAEAVLRLLQEKLDISDKNNQRMMQCNENMINLLERREAYEVILENAKKSLEETYMLSRENQRAPMELEVNLLVQITLALDELGRKEEEIELYKFALENMKHSKVHIRHRYRSYSVLSTNLAIETRSVELAIKNIKYALECGKLNSLYLNNMLIACSLDKCEANLLDLKRALKDTYYLCELAMNEVDRQNTLRFYEKKIGEPMF